MKVFKVSKTMIKKRINMSVKSLRTDNGLVFDCESASQVCSQDCFARYHVCVVGLYLSGIAKRKNKALFDKRKMNVEPS